MAVMLYIAYDMIFVSCAFTITVNSCYAGLLSGLPLEILMHVSVIKIEREPLSNPA